MSRETPGRVFFPNRRGFLALTLAQACTIGFGRAWANEPAKRPFVLFDTLAYKARPSLEPFGIRLADVIYEDRFFGAGVDHRRTLPAPQTIRRLGQEYGQNNRLTILDVEAWGTLPQGEMIERYIFLISQFRASYGDGLLGHYGLIPSWGYKAILKGRDSAEYRQWLSQNDRLYALIDLVDVFCPSLYTYTPKREDWVLFARGTVAECRRLSPSKPVYPFIWPDYHAFAGSLSETPLDREYWRLQLETLNAVADGAIIWGGYKKFWDPEAEWWIETKDFIEKHTQ
jgi:hypothetical protein